MGTQKETRRKAERKAARYLQQLERERLRKAAQEAATDEQQTGTPRPEPGTALWTSR